MNAKGHLNFTAYSLSVYGTGLYIGEIPQKPSHIIQFIAGAFIGATFADIDHRENQWASIFPLWKLHDMHKKWAAKRDKGKKKKKWRNFIFRHGGITHTALVNSWIFILAYFSQSYLAAGIGFGHMTHLYIDHVTGNKLSMLWWPLFDRKR